MKAGMSAAPILVHVCRAREGEPHPEPLPAHRIARSCIDVHGYPRCYGAAHDGPAGCHCIDTLTPEQHQQCRADAWQAFRERGGEACDDCAFRKGSPESERLDEIARSTVPFRCHKGMPVDARPGYPQRDAYCPGILRIGSSIDAPDYPTCAGWKRAHAALARR
jgi:hypothetical protein